MTEISDDTSPTREQAKEAVTQVLKVCTAAINKRPMSDGQLRLVEALRVIDLYLTGKDTERTNHYGVLRDLEAAGETAEFGADWLIYLSDAGYTRLFISPGGEPYQITLQSGDYSGYEEVKRKWNGIHRTY